MDERTRLKLKDAARRTAPRRPDNPPIERATTLINAEAKDLRSSDLGVTYGISGLQVHDVLREALAELEHAQRVFLLPTGLAAATVAILAMLDAGDDVILTDSSYAPTRRFSEVQLKRLGITARFAPPRASADALMAMSTDKTRLIAMESPGSLTFEIPDAPAIAAAARTRGIATMLDNTWAAGLFFKPLDHGVDLSVQALSKYVGGHSDVFLGSIAVNDAKIAKRVDDVIEDFGWYVSPDDAYLALRGLRTLPVRLAQHQQSALKVAEWLEQQPEVARVLYPALPSSPDPRVVDTRLHRRVRPDGRGAEARLARGRRRRSWMRSSFSAWASPGVDSRASPPTKTPSFAADNTKPNWPARWCVCTSGSKASTT